MNNIKGKTKKVMPIWPVIVMTVISVGLMTAFLVLLFVNKELAKKPEIMFSLLIPAFLILFCNFIYYYLRSRSIKDFVENKDQK